MTRELMIRTLSMNIVNQLFDEAEVPVEKRHTINDKCDRFVQKLIGEYTVAAVASVQNSINNWTCRHCTGRNWYTATWCQQCGLSRYTDEV